MIKKQISASALTSHLGYWLRIVSNSVSHSFARKLDSNGVTVAEWVVLREMYGANGSTSPSAIADLTGLTRGAVSKLVERLLQKGLIDRAVSSGDRRYQDIRLTERAVALVPQLAALADQNDEEFFSILSKSERDHLSSTLRKVANAHRLRRHPIE